MGRDIRFRGKRLDNGEWVYGNLEIVDGKYRILEQHSYAGRVIDCAVDEDTVGQFTGLTDKNRFHIYEGDIVESSNGIIGIVEYFESLTWEGGGLHPGYYCKSWFDPMEAEEHGLSHYQEFDGCKIIGNIHEGVKQ